MLASCERSPSSKIIFLSQNSNLDVVRAAFGTGGSGYVLKTDAGDELLPAVDAVLGGKQFVSSSLKSYEFGASPGEDKAPHRHEVLFYSDDTVLLDRVTHFIAVALKAGDAAIVFATKPYRDSLLQRLKAEGVEQMTPRNSAYNLAFMHISSRTTAASRTPPWQR